MVIMASSPLMGLNFTDYSRKIGSEKRKDETVEEVILV